MVSGVAGRFFVWCQEFSKSGFVVPKSLNPLSTLMLAQYGQPVPARLEAAIASQSCPFEQVHQNFLFDPADVVSGVAGKFFEGCQELARSGCVVVMSLTP